MTNEQYERLFSVFLAPSTYRRTSSNASFVRQRTDEALQARHYVSIERGATQNVVTICSPGKHALRNRLGLVDT